MASGNLSSLQKRYGFVVFAFAEEIETFESRDLRFELLANRFFPSRKQIAERQRIVEVFVLVGDQNVDLHVRNRQTNRKRTCSCSGRIFKRITDACEQTTTPSTTLSPNVSNRTIHASSVQPADFHRPRRRKRDHLRCRQHLNRT